MEQMIKINVPDGFYAVWDEEKQKIEFKKVQKWKSIKTFDDVLRYLNINKDCLDNGIYSPTLCEYITISKWQLIMKAFIRASNDQCQLTEGKVYVPYYYIVYNNKYIPNETNETDVKVRSGITNNKECTLVGGIAYGSSSGLGFSPLLASAAPSNAYFGLCGFSSREVAKHVSEHFTWELYESTLGWRTNEIKWL